MSDTIEQAIASLRNESISEQKREKAIHLLEEAATPQAIEALIAALRDRDSGVRWAASQALGPFR
jgi:HEAT repeat protein